MIYKFCSYAVIIFGGTISGALVGIVTGPIKIHLSVDNMGTLGGARRVLGCLGMHVRPGAATSSCTQP